MAARTTPAHDRNTHSNPRALDSTLTNSIDSATVMNSSEGQTSIPNSSDDSDDTRSGAERLIDGGTGSHSGYPSFTNTQPRYNGRHPVGSNMNGSARQATIQPANATFSAGQLVHSIPHDHQTGTLQHTTDASEADEYTPLLNAHPVEPPPDYATATATAARRVAHSNEDDRLLTWAEIRAILVRLGVEERATATTTDSDTVPPRQGSSTADPERGGVEVPDRPRRSVLQHVGVAVHTICYFAWMLIAGTIMLLSTAVMTLTKPLWTYFKRHPTVAFVLLVMVVFILRSLGVI